MINGWFEERPDMPMGWYWQKEIVEFKSMGRDTEIFNRLVYIDDYSIHILGMNQNTHRRVIKTYYYGPLIPPPFKEEA